VHLPNWHPRLPDLDLRTIVLHWTAGDYRTVYPAYHFCVALDDAGEPIVCATRDLALNARDVRTGDAEYAAHVAGRNSFACGLAVCGMARAAPHDFGPFPLRDDMLDGLCRIAAALCAQYGIAIEPHAVFTHAEAAIADGYFGAGENERWDIARLAPASSPLVAAEAREIGDALRERIRRLG
jgi:hypothetical protein